METPSLIQEQRETSGKIMASPEVEEEVNLYPVVRHVFLTLCIILALAIILFLIYQNGKSIYDKGI